jgi:hypothetical protein
MFKIIGGDGRQYGPVTAEQVREWIAAGRANAQTQIQREGETDWKPISDVPEFADALTFKPLSQLPAPAPSEPAPDPTALANEVMARGCEVNIGSCLGRAWDLFMTDFWPMLGISVLVFLIIGSVGILAGPLMGGLFWYYLKKIRREPAQLSDAFAGFNKSFVPLFLGAIVVSLLITVGLAACVLPGIYLAVAWKLTLPIIIDKRIGFWDAMEVSRKVITRCWWSFFLFLIVCALINIGGLLICVGIFFTWPLTTLALAYLYEDLFGSAKPAVA